MRSVGEGLAPPANLRRLPESYLSPPDSEPPLKEHAHPCGVHRTAFPGPRYGGRVFVRFYSASGARNLSGGQRFLPAHWGLVFPKLRLVRFPFRAWLCRAEVPSANSGGGPGASSLLSTGGSIAVRRGGACPSRCSGAVLESRRRRFKVGSSWLTNTVSADYLLGLIDEPRALTPPKKEGT